VTHPTPGSVLGRRNPLAGIGAAVAITGVAVIALDPVTPALLLVATLALTPLTGLDPRGLLLRVWPLALGAVSVAFSNALYGSSGPGVAAVLGLRVAAAALPGVLVFATIDPTDLADGLVQHLRAPARFAYGTLAAVRMVPLLTAEWHTIGAARRARGIDAGRNPLTALRLFGGRVFGLLVGAIRRASRLAVAMDARGFDSRVHRTYARTSAFTGADVGTVLVGVVISAAAVTISVMAGTWHPLFL
jgi:energy-coupling factor transport system permease protein